MFTTDIGGALEEADIKKDIREDETSDFRRILNWAKNFKSQKVTALYPFLVVVFQFFNIMNIVVYFYFFPFATVTYTHMIVNEEIAKLDNSTARLNDNTFYGNTQFNEYFLNQLEVYKSQSPIDKSLVED